MTTEQVTGLVSYAEAAAALRVSEKTIQRRVQRGQLSPVREVVRAQKGQVAGRTHRIAAAEIIELERKQWSMVKQPGPAKAPWPTLWAELATMWMLTLDAVGKTQATMRLRRGHLMHFACRHQTFTPTEVEHKNLIAYLAANRVSPETRRARIATLREFFGWLLAEGHLTENPAARLESMPVPRPKHRSCPSAVITAALARDDVDDRTKLAIRIEANTGVRLDETVRIEVEHVWLSDEGVFWLRVIGKGGHERDVPLPDDLADELTAIQTRYVFPGLFDRGHLSTSQMGKLVSRALGGEWTAHSLRHRYATEIYRKTKDIKAVQALLGHASIATTQRYIQIDERELFFAASAAMMPRGNS